MFSKKCLFLQMRMQLTIIIPVYNVRETLKRCVGSIVNQSFQDWEMLLVDDGSTDGSGQLADELAETDGRISVCHKQNGGLSDARNYGMERGRGEYFTFVDSDDQLAPGTLEPLMQMLEENPDCDVLEYDVHVHAGHETQHRLSLPERKWHNAREYWHETKAWEHCYACNKIFRREVLRNTTFPRGRVFEDVWLWAEVLVKNPCVMTTSEGSYEYLWNEKGITARASQRQLWQLLCAQLRAAWLMGTTPFARNGRQLYRSMMCRVYDIVKFSLSGKNPNRQTA